MSEPSKYVAIPASTPDGEDVEMLLGGGLPDGFVALAQGEDVIVMDRHQFSILSVGLSLAVDAVAGVPITPGRAAAKLGAVS